MPKSRRRESSSSKLAAARFARSQSSQEDNKMDLSITRSPDKWRSRMETGTSYATEDAEYAFNLPSPVHMFQNPDDIPNEVNIQ